MTGYFGECSYKLLQIATGRRSHRGQEPVKTPAWRFAELQEWTPSQSGQTAHSLLEVARVTKSESLALARRVLGPWTCVRGCRTHKNPVSDIIRTERKTGQPAHEPSHAYVSISKGFCGSRRKLSIAKYFSPLGPGKGNQVPTRITPAEPRPDGPSIH